ncbi:hypothetical protein LO763_11035 [Glycomyces sp. A-F 0318]|nr:hypothetical protein [Glycomyces amatae]
MALEYRAIREDGAALDRFDAAARLAPAPGQVNVAPLAWLHRADLEFERSDDAALPPASGQVDAAPPDRADGDLRRAAETAAEAALRRLRELDRTWCFPSAADNDALARLRARRPEDPVLAGLAGHWLYAAGRRDEAIAAWTAAAATGDPVVLRNLGVAAHNVQGDPEAAASWYERAREAAPDDARLLYEADQLDGRRGVAPAARLAVLEDRRDLVETRDDLAVQFAELLTAAGRPGDALDLLGSRAFQPWEGGEGRVLAAWEDAHLALSRRALADGDPKRAVDHAAAALAPVPSLGEARHLLANTADLHLALGDALAAAGDEERARTAWATAAAQQGDFQSMEVRAHSEHTAAAVTALRRLGEHEAAQALRDGLARYIDEQAGARARVDYFATSLPTMLLFTADVQAAHDTRVLVLRAQLALLDGDHGQAAELARSALDRDPLNSAAKAGLTAANAMGADAAAARTGKAVTD